MCGQVEVSLSPTQPQTSRFYSSAVFGTRQLSSSKPTVSRAGTGCHFIENNLSLARKIILINFDVRVDELE